MTKFMRIKDTGIRKMYECNAEGERIRVVALVGQVSELLTKDIIFDDNTDGNYDKWLILAQKGECIIEQNTLDEAKAYAKDHWQSLGW